MDAQHAALLKVPPDQEAVRLKSMLITFLPTEMVSVAGGRYTYLQTTYMHVVPRREWPEDTWHLIVEAIPVMYGRSRSVLLIEVMPNDPNLLTESNMRLAHLSQTPAQLPTSATIFISQGRTSVVVMNAWTCTIQVITSTTEEQDQHRYAESLQVHNRLWNSRLQSIQNYQT
jgi:hypothetical protein